MTKREFLRHWHKGGRFYVQGHLSKPTFSATCAYYSNPLDRRTRIVQVWVSNYSKGGSESFACTLNDISPA